MAHNLATTNGQTAMMYTRKVPSHRQGTKLNEPATAREALEASGLNFPVELKSLVTTEGTAVPQRKGVVRSDTGDVANSTFDAARVSRFEVTRVAVPRRWRSFHGLSAAFFCVRNSDSAQLSSYAVLHSRVVASRVRGRGRSESPSTAVACLGYQLNSVSPDGDGAARRWGCKHSTLVSARARGETPPLAE